MTLNFLRVVPQQIELVIPTRQKQGVLNTLTAIRKLFGPKGKYWIKNSFKTTKDGLNAFCLVGAEREVNTEFEPAARSAIALAIDLYRDGQELEDGQRKSNLNDVTIGFNDDTATTWEDISAILRSARRLVRNAATK